MSQLTAFIRKEFTEFVRSGKIIIFLAVFIIFGIMNPATAKLTPWLMDMMSKQLAENGMIVSNVEVTAMTSWEQFFKNIPMVLIVFVVMFSAIVTKEYQSSTLTNIITKGMKRWKILASKAVLMIVVWTVGCLTGYGITYGYNAYFWDNGVAHNIFFACFAFYLAGVWLISVIMLASSAGNTTSFVMMSALAAFAAAYIIGVIPSLTKYVPTYLMASTDLLTGAKAAQDYLAAIAVTLGLIVLNAFAAVKIFKHKIL